MRDSFKLQELATNLFEKYKTKIYPLVLDLTKQDAIDTIAQYLEKEKLSVDLLINNAGFGIHGAFHETNIQKRNRFSSFTNYNNFKFNKTCSTKYAKNKFGYILNVGSVYSFSPVPYQSVYGGCKSFYYHLQLL